MAKQEVGFLYKMVSLEGCLGMGKTTLMKHLQAQRILHPLFQETLGREPVILFVYEPSDVWEKDKSLQDFYTSRKSPSAEVRIHGAYTFQMHVVVTRTQAILKAIEETPQYDILLLERSLYTDRYIFWEQQDKTPALHEDYLHNWQLNLKEVPSLTHAFHLTCPNALEVIKKRIHKRGRPEEVDMPDAYLKKLIQSHNNCYSTNNMDLAINTTILDVGVDAALDTTIFMKYGKTIHQELSKYL